WIRYPPRRSSRHHEADRGGRAISLAKLFEQGKLRGMRVLGIALDPPVTAVGFKLPRLGIVGEVVLQGFLVHARGESRIEDREARFDPAQQVAIEPVRT